MRVLVTGGAGFIASHVVDALVGAGHHVTIVDDLSTGKRENIHPDASFYQLDIRSADLRHVFEKERPEVVNHHAAQMDVRVAVRDPEFDASINVLGSLNVLECARRQGIANFLFASSGGAVYGDLDDLPASESAEVAPLSPYGLTKYTFEQYLALYRRLYGMRYCALRYPNVYGPRQDPGGEAGVIAIFTGQLLRGEIPTIYGDGTKSRDYVLVHDVVDANMRLMSVGDAEVVNIGSATEVTDREVFDAVREAVGADVEPRFAPTRIGEVSRICLDATRMAKLTGWRPTVSFREGVERTVGWYRERF